MFTSTVERTLRNPSATKTGPGRRHVSGHKKTSGKIRRNGKLHHGWMHQRLMRHFAEQALQKIAEKKAKVATLQPQFVPKEFVPKEFVPPESPFQFDAPLQVKAENTSMIEAASDENRIVLVIRENPGASIKLIAHWVPELSDTQIERRLKKLREAGHIRYDKSAKGWFVV